MKRHWSGRKITKNKGIKVFNLKELNFQKATRKGCFFLFPGFLVSRQRDQQAQVIYMVYNKLKLFSQKNKKKLLYTE